jgi:DNA-binding NtrC family response regulator
VRVIGATNASLGELARQGEFRQDLLYRLNVLTLEVPPLRERGEDMILLAQHFLRTLCIRYRKPDCSLHPDALHALRAHDWPGNVRELENLIHREFLLADQSPLQLAALPPAVRPATPERRVSERRGGDASKPAAESSRNVDSAPAAFREAKARAIADFEKEYVRNLLTQAQGNVSLAARIAGKERSRFHRLVRKYHLHPREFKSAASSRQSI